MWLLRGVGRGHAWLFLGGMCGCSEGVCGCSKGEACVVALKGMQGCSGGCVVALGACMVAPGGSVCGCSQGACMVALGGCTWFLQGGHAWDTMRYGDTINEQAVRILLECILVLIKNCYLLRNGKIVAIIMEGLPLH